MNMGQNWTSSKLPSPELWIPEGWSPGGPDWWGRRGFTRQPVSGSACVVHLVKKKLFAGGLGLASAVRVRAAAHWASWAGTLGLPG